MERLTEELYAAADAVATVDRDVFALSISPSVFSAGDAGLPGLLGRQMHAHWSAVLAARADEAAAAAVVLQDLAAAVAHTADTYSQTDQTAAAQIERSSW